MADSESEDQERTIITQLFHLGHSYDDIVGLLSKCHGINISVRTLKRRLKDWGMSRRYLEYDPYLWHNLRMKGILVPRVVVQEMLKEIDPNGVELRKAHKLKRRVYRSLGPKSTWHADGYDKLKPYGFPMHACIDGFSRKVIWLYVTRSNNYPDNIASYYLDAVKQLGGCPRELDTDLGTENGTMAGIHSFFLDDPNSHRYVASPRNQRIECWWSFLRKNWSTWWMNLFKDMIEKAVHTADKLHLECLWFCFAELLQNDLKRVGDSWNTHYIRKSRHDTVAGRPDAIFHLPESYGGIDNLLVPVSQHDMSYAYTHLVQQDEDDEYQEYFRYVLHSLNKKKPEHWREALQMYEELLHIAVNGC
ncbi:predicted protein [Nematostella vectensis]|uniref:Integrase catalytic domain-containing protein n=1 Tax=Nematostella vectensis TaxID=45351 RepID=A7RM65_NEMVE|nr:predicted protein [Nematostella vectensis]|eukprot:XP_001639611.1 predicted protein [Nematostella vectensis]